MHPKIRLIIGLLIVAAMGLLGTGAYFARNLFVSNASLLAPISSGLPRPDLDTDKDGLGDTEESYWNTDFQNKDTDGDGYLDGEEIASGHDPLKRGPDDLLGKSNITEKVTGLLIGGLYSGDLKAGNSEAAFDKALGDLSLAAVSEFYDLKTANAAPAIRTVNRNDGEEETYLNDIARIIQENLFAPAVKLYPESLSDMSRQKTYFLTLGENFKKTREKLIAAAIPKDWKNFHLALIGIITRFQNNYESIGNYERDPIRAALALNELQTVMPGEIHSLIGDLRNQLANRTLNLTGDFYEVLRLTSI